MKLAVVAGQKPSLLHELVFILEGKQAMEATGIELIGQFQSALEEYWQQFIPALFQTKQSLPGSGGVGDGTDQLWEIGLAIALIGVSPGMIEDKLAIGVVLLIERHGGYQLTFFIDCNMPGQPAES